MHYRRSTIVWPLLLCVILVAGCVKKPVTEEISAGVTGTEVVPEETTIGTEHVGDYGDDVSSEDLGRSGAKLGGTYAVLDIDPGLSAKAAETGMLHTIYFDFDMYGIKPAERERLTINGKWLKLNPAVRIVIEGHADERGETEYNLALGDKRAMTVQTYLAKIGVSTDRLSTISYGEEKPANPGHNEEAWAKNRRAELMIRN